MKRFKSMLTLTLLAFATAVTAAATETHHQEYTLRIRIQHEARHTVALAFENPKHILINTSHAGAHHVTLKKNTPIFFAFAGHTFMVTHTCRNYLSFLPSKTKQDKWISHRAIPIVGDTTLNIWINKDEDCPDCVDCRMIKD